MMLSQKKLNKYSDPDKMMHSVECDFSLVSSLFDKVAVKKVKVNLRLIQTDNIVLSTSVIMNIGHLCKIS